LLTTPKKKKGMTTKYLRAMRTTLLCCLLIGTLAATARADGVVSRTLEDSKLYFTAPARWDSQDWLYFGSAVAAIGIAHQFDDNVRAHFVDGKNAARVGEDPKSTRDAIPAAVLVAGTWIYATLLRDHDGYREGWSMLEAGGLSTISALALKFALGRERPNDTSNVDRWFTSGSSFPSLHTTAAFAVGTVLAESGSDEYRLLRRALGYGVAGATAYLRLRENEHWLSDTVAGAAIGAATARFVLQRQEQYRNDTSINLLPVEKGLVLNYSVAIR
jgi:membrane-associated phospholipid phosphatase